ncbi:hypothetical protein TWF718_009325 [Orbilia javanica]|uniref:Uncharacterized protein n=1 Tax=Orbilia javanica TaxID=47235 RepID=A0AAN8RBQ6_9PEZI
MSGRGDPKAYMTPHARGEGGPGESMPTASRDHSPTKSKGRQSRQGFSRPPTRQERPPTRQERPPSRQERPPTGQERPPSRPEWPPIRQERPPSRHDKTPNQGRPPSRQNRDRRPKGDAALRLSRKEIGTLLAGAKKKADPDQESPPKSPDIGLRPHSRFGLRAVIPCMIPGPKNSSRSEQFLNSHLNTIPRPERARNAPLRTNTPSRGPQMPALLPVSPDQSNIDGPSFISPSSGSSLPPDSTDPVTS